MHCLECGNCKTNEPMYYCTARNEFVVNESYRPEKEKDRSGWKKGKPGYELHRRRTRKDREDIRKII